MPQKHAEQIVELIRVFSDRTSGDHPEDQVEMLLDFIEAFADPQAFAEFLGANMTVRGLPASHSNSGPRGNRAALRP